MNTNDKLEETKFFLELLDTLEQRAKPLTTNNSIKKEASFILSAILNGFYSITELAKDNGTKNAEVEIFKNSHPLIYSGSGKGGLRNTTVHVKHIDIDHAGYIPPKRNAVNINLRETQKLVPDKSGNIKDVDFNLMTCFYIEINGDMNRVLEFANNHYYDLLKFVATL